MKGTDDFLLQRKLFYMPSKKTPSKNKPRLSKQQTKKLSSCTADDMRDRINVLALIDALENHVLGVQEMTSTQVSAALALLKKTLPDISESRLEKTAVSALTHEEALKELD